jgi:hypothetical protein
MDPNQVLNLALADSTGKAGPADEGLATPSEIAKKNE